MLTLCCIWAEEHQYVRGKQPVRWESCHRHPQCSGPSSWPPSRGPSIHQSPLCGTETSLKRKQKSSKTKSVAFFHFFPPLQSDALTDATADPSKQSDHWASTSQQLRAIKQKQSPVHCCQLHNFLKHLCCPWALHKTSSWRDFQWYKYNFEALSVTL